MARRGGWLLLFVGLCPAIAFGQGQLDAIRQQASQPDAAPSADSLQGDNPVCDSWPDDDPARSDDQFGEAIGELLLGGFIAPFQMPQRLLHDDLEVPACFPAYPYIGRYPGYLWLGNMPNGADDEALANSMKRSRQWSVRLAAEEGNDFRGMNRVGIRAQLDTTSRIGLTSNWNYLREALGGGRHDATWLGDTNVTFRFAQSEWLQFYTGAGFRVMTDAAATHFGTNFVYGFDWFPKKPLVFSTAFDLGNLGSAFVVHARSTAGLTFDHFEAFAGYDFMRIGSVNVQGPMLGLRFWY